MVLKSTDEGMARTESNASVQSSEIMAVARFLFRLLAESNCSLATW